MLAGILMVAPSAEYLVDYATKQRVSDVFNGREILPKCPSDVHGSIWGYLTWFVGPRVTIFGQAKNKTQNVQKIKVSRQSFPKKTIALPDSLVQ